MMNIEVTIISAEDLRLSRRPIKKNAIVTVQTDPNCYQSTSIDKDGGSYPWWNQKLYLQLSHNVTKFLHVEVQCKTGLNNVRLIGVASIPVSDFIGDYIPPYYLHFLSYRLKDRNGERNGIVNLSVRVKQPHEYVGKSKTLQYPADANAQAPSNYNKNYDAKTPMENNYRGEIAMGIPVVPYGL